MSEEKKMQSDSSDADYFIRTLQFVKLLIDGTEEEISKVTMGSFQEALNCAQLACPKVEWVRRARVNWLRRGMKGWSDEIDRRVKAGKPLTEYGCSPYCPIEGAEGLMSHQTFTHFITVGYIGIDCNAVMDEYLALLGHAAVVAAEHHWKHEMAKLILRRTGCNRADDPHRDEAACRALLHEYKLEHFVPELQKSRSKA
ncbi:MAG: hypothetical protein PHC70_04035 [Patescibacteria group bacterium]|nr:hypothetical protein [Patescibacteria group bacterium]